MHLYFVAVMLPPELDKEIRSIQQEMAANYGATRQLKIPVHITLLPPFRNESEENVNAAFQEACSLIEKPQEIELNGFGEFRNKVLFVNVTNSDALTEMRAKIVTTISKQLNLEFPEHYQHFHPHITTANRDLTRRAFLKAWPIYRKRPFEASFKNIKKPC